MNYDLISRAAALNVIQRNAFHEGRQWVFRDKIIKELCDIFAIDAEPVRHGRWEEPYPNDIWDCYECSCCSEKHDRTWNYCPNCGAKMDKEGENA